MSVGSPERVESALSAAAIRPERRGLPVPHGLLGRSGRSTTGSCGASLPATPDGEALWQPTEAVLLAVCAGEGPSFRGCCQVLNVFASAHHAERYLRALPDVESLAISIPEAVAVGEAVFGAVVEDA